MPRNHGEDQGKLRVIEPAKKKNWSIIRHMPVSITIIIGKIPLNEATTKIIR
jgi:hypothetical protein